MKKASALYPARFVFSGLGTPRHLCILVGGLLIASHLALARLSFQFTEERPMLSKPFVALLGLELLAGLVWLGGSFVLRRNGLDRFLLYWVLGVGILLRTVFFASAPILEDDYFRYLWDGAVTAQRMNPFTFAPDEVLIAEEEASVPLPLRELAGQGRAVLLQINHGNLRTIYPPLAQGAFALAYLLRPWSLNAWRVVLLVFDLASVGLLALLLHHLRLPLGSLVIYWWNPLLLKEIYNSGHMDIIALPFVLGAVWLALKKRFSPAAILLGLAVGAKVWPVLLLPILLRPLLSQPGKLLRALMLFALVSSAMFYPIWQAGLQADSGFVAFSQRWEMNDSFFMLILWGVDGLGRLLTLDGGMSQSIARAITALLLGGLLFWKVRRQASDEMAVCENCLVLVAALFLLSPVQFPWYATWLLPFLALRPRGSLMLLTVLLPLYYLRFYLVASGNTKLFDNGIVWVEFLPVWFLLAWETFISKKRRVSTLAEASG